MSEKRMTAREFFVVIGLAAAAWAGVVGLILWLGPYIIDMAGSGGL